MLLCSMIAVGLFGICFDYTPRYKEYVRYPTAMVTMNNNDNTSFILISVKWPVTYPACNVRETNDVTLCDGSSPLTNQSFYDDLKKYLICEDENGQPYDIETLDTNDFNDHSTMSVNISNEAENGTFCELESPKAITTDIFCDIEIQDNPYLGKCFNAEGSHAKMFWVYLVLRTCWQTFMSAGFSFLDGTSMCLVKEHQGSYAMIIVWQSIASIFGPLLSGVLVQDSEDAGGKKYCGNCHLKFC